MFEKPRILFVTREAPFGKHEAFIIQELLKMKEYFEIIVVPVIPRFYPQYTDAKELLKDSIIMPLINFRILIGFLKFFVSNPYEVLSVLGDIIRESRSIKILLRNLSVIPKAVYVSRLLKISNISHIHVHWATIQTTFGLVVSRILKIPFSFTVYRYDIGENNMLRRKVLDASFVRAPSKEAKEEIIELTHLSGLAHKIQVIHTGVPIPEFKGWDVEMLRKTYTIACPANLVEKKGHRYLVEACALLKKRDLDFRCLLIGDGPDKAKIKSLIEEKGLENSVFLEGYYPHSKLMEMLRKKQIDLVVLPSIITEEGFREGIPVTLIEAMGFGVPVVSTNTGGIPELLEGGAGIMVNQRDPLALADAIYNVLTNIEYRCELIKNGYDRVYKEFNSDDNMKRLTQCIQSNIAPSSVKVSAR